MATYNKPVESKKPVEQPAATPVARKQTLSWGDAAVVYTACSFPIFLWAIPQVLFYISSWLQRLTIWELVGTVSYVLAVAFVESLVVFLVVMTILLIVPTWMPKKKLVSLVTVFVALTIAYFILLNLTQERAITNGNFIGALLGLALYAALLVAAYLLIKRNDRLSNLISAFMERLAPLAILYGLVGLICAILVLVRNL